MCRLSKYPSGNYTYVDTTHLPPRLIMGLCGSSAGFCGSFEITNPDEALALMGELSTYITRFEEYESGAR